MRFRPNASLRVAIAALVLVAGTSSAFPQSSAPTDKDIARALERVKADPDLSPEKTVHTLKWASSTDTTTNPEVKSGSFLVWLAQLLGWFAQSARVLVWTAVVVAVGLLAIYLVSLVRIRNAGAKTRRVAAPTHVQDLDIRPESLPENIGAAARTLWDSGDQRAALSLLYRGLLSRLVHVHNVPIRDSSTEGDCLRLSATRLRAASIGYVTRLIGIWQHAVYGGQPPQTPALYSLCDEFSTVLDVA